MTITRASQAVPQEMVGSPKPRSTGFDWWLGTIALILLCLGLVMVASASISIAERRLDRPLYYFNRQAVFVGLGLLCAWITLKVDLRVWHKLSPWLLVFGMAMLGLVLVPGVGHEVNGATRWIRIGGFSFQPSELMKLNLSLYLAGYLVRRSEEVRSLLSGFLKPIIVLTLIAGLLLLEPDYGATVVLFSAAFGMMFLGGVPFLSFLGWVSLVSCFLGTIVVVAPYRVERLITFIDPWADPFGSGFQLTQALIAIGRGEWFGVGLGNSVQKLFYLPEAHTDFLFAVLAEELGLVGMAFVIGLFAFLVWRAFYIAHRAQHCGDLFGSYLAYGLGLLIGFQAFVNIGVNMGILPTKGLTLPLMSYGGSSILVNCILVGLLLRIDHESRRAA